MRRFPAVTLWLLIATFILAMLSGCGRGKTTSTTGTPAKIQIAPATLSINLGPPGQGNTGIVLAAVLDADGNAVPATKVPPIAFKSSNPTIAGVTANGLVCGGSWDANFIVCNPGPVGTAQITATGGGLTSDPVTVYVHPRVDSITVSPVSVDCKSQGQTQQMTAHAISNGVEVTDTVGPFTWTSVSVDVVTFDTETNGLVTAKTPGRTSIIASLIGSGGVNGLPATFTTCPVKSITLHVQDSTDTSVTLDKAASKAVVADAVDTAGHAVTGLTLSIVSSVPSVGGGSIPPANPTNTGSVIASGSGTTVLTPVCAPPSCNANLPIQYGNVFTMNVNGTSTPLVYAANSEGTSLVPMNTATTPLALGTAITLPSKPNSLRFSPSGNRVYMGSDTAGSMYLDTGSTAPVTLTGVTGKVLTVTPDGESVVISDLAGGKVFVSTVGASSTVLSIPGATGAAYSPDASKLFIVGGNTLFVFQPGATLKSIALGGTANDAAMLTPGWFAYVAQNGSIRARATCDDSPAGSVSAASPKLIAPLPNGAGVIAADSPNIDLVHANSMGAGCPPAANNALTRADVGEAFTARQIIPLANSSKVYITSNVGLLVYDVATNSVSKIALAGGAEPFTGGATIDSATLYIGASDNAIHIINVANGTDDQQIATPFTPDLVAVAPR